MQAAQAGDEEVQERQTVYKPKLQYKEVGASDEAVSLTTPEVPRDRDAFEPIMAGAQRRVWVSPPADLTNAMHCNAMGTAVSSSSMSAPGSGQHPTDVADGPRDAAGALPTESGSRATSSSAPRRHETRNSSPSSTRPCRNAGLLTRHAAPARPSSVSKSRAVTPSKKAAVGATPSSSSLPSAVPRSPNASRERRSPVASPAITPRNGAPSRSKTREASAPVITDFPVLDDVAKLERQSESAVHQLRQSITLMQRMEAQISVLRGCEERLHRLRPAVLQESGYAKQRTMPEASFSMMTSGNEPNGREHNLLTQELERCHKEIQELKAEVQEKDRVIAQLLAVVPQEAKGLGSAPPASHANVRSAATGHASSLGWSHSGKFEVRPAGAPRGSARHAIHG
mmetsp:Transcript_1031/g.2870  ORF Transcript_1031/g.2870 Transcript_1031/m.2870 type:complete len:398 (-) Transcript_1031:27-1220(-)